MRFAAGAAAPDVTMTSTLSRTSSAAIDSKRSVSPSAHRTSNAIVRPSIQPSSRSRCTNAAIQGLQAADVLVPRNPIVGNFAGCCARAKSGHAPAAPPTMRINCRRLMHAPASISIPSDQPAACAKVTSASGPMIDSRTAAKIFVIRPPRRPAPAPLVEFRDPSISRP